MPFLQRMKRSHMRRTLGAPRWFDNGGKIGGCWAAYQPKGAASLAASYIDLTGNGHDATPIVAPTWNISNGWIFNGSDQYLLTSFIPAVDQSQSMLVQFTNLTRYGTDINTSANPCGVDEGGNQDFGFDCGASAQWWNNGSYLNNSQTPTEGNLGIGGSKAYIDGVDQGSSIPTGSTITLPVAIGCENRATPRNYASVYIQALAIYDVALSPGEVAVIAAAMAAL